MGSIERFRGSSLALVALAPPKVGAIRREACSTHHLVVLVGLLLDGHSPEPSDIALPRPDRPERAAVSMVAG